MSSSEPDAGRGCSGRRGKLIVISGPSGTGKTSICNALLERIPHTVWSVSVTTRRQRPGESGGRSYEFVTRDEFSAREVAGELLESAEYIGERYGTPRQPVEEALDRGQNVVLEIDVQGGIQVAEKVPDSVRIFVLPPDDKSLRSRLEGRRTEAAEELARRLEKADGEIAAARHSGCYQHFVVNDCLETAIAEVMAIIEKESGTV
jgi:guanylate kinase